MFVMCGPQERSDDIVTPRSRTSSVAVIVAPLGVVYWYSSDVSEVLIRQ